MKLLSVEDSVIYVISNSFHILDLDNNHLKYNLQEIAMLLLCQKNQN